MIAASALNSNWSLLERVVTSEYSDGEYRGPVPRHLLVDRDPCPRCGARGDLGCGHSAKFIGVEMHL